MLAHLRTETDPKAVKRLTVALLYLDGFSPNRIEQLLGIPAQTAYDWLDAPRSGRPSYLSPEQWSELTATLQASPSEAGVDAPAWKLLLVRDYR